MSFFSLETIRSVVGGRWLVEAADPDLEAGGVSIDTRDDLAGRLYIALSGARHDGHQFLSQAEAGGAVAALVESGRVPDPTAGSLPLLAVEDTQQAMWALAAAWRSQLEATVVAITGSAGKTTLRRMVQAICETNGPTTASRRSFNNHIGVPLSLLAADRSDRYLVLEIGTNAPGEIRALAELARPDIGVITSIGRAHLEGLGSLEGVAIEKGALLKVLPERGTAILPADSAQAGLLESCVPKGVRTIGFGAVHGALRLSHRRSLSLTGEQAIMLEGGLELRSRHPGAHNALNTCAAVCVSRSLDIPDEQAASAICSLGPDSMRLSPLLLEGTGTMLLNDVYNSNPEAVAAALETFGEIAADAPRRMVILGDMLELGPDENALHAEVGRQIARLDQQTPIEVAIFIGERSRHGADALVAEGFTGLVATLPGLDDVLADTVAAAIQPGDAVLLKASRGMAFERIIEAARERGRKLPELASH
ncbi:MAG: UDP-N-acetylmuramoyl-tripeptide--D-alanyl-D-alanine ligase [Phycisphaerales bacterium]|nr:UDP-N-acetylmuramoyl-tripeptide--D-alanyl-D-alanine ligase [Phycisphaerales bacterium]